MAKTITIEGVGPIEGLEIPVPDGGGVVVLRGRNGSGKTEALEATKALLGGKERPGVRDGESAGVVSGLGVSLTIARRANRAGDLEVRHLDGTDPSELVDPGLKDVEAADAARIRALCVLADAKADPVLFSNLAAGLDVDEILPSDQLKAPDLPTLAARFKRAFEARARTAETEAAGLLREAQGVRSVVEGIDTGIPTDALLLDQAADQATRRLAGMEALVDQATRAQGKVAAAERRMAEIPEADVADLHAQVATRLDGLRLQRDALEELRSRVAVAEEHYRASVDEHDVAQRAAQTAERAAKEREDLTRAIGEALAFSRGPSPEEVEHGRLVVAETRRHQEAGAVARHALEQLERASGLLARHGEAARTAVAFRAAAQCTEVVLSEAIAKVAPRGLKVVGGRLVIHHALREKEVPFCELSHGERWRIALDVAIDAIGEGGLLVTRQESWEALDPTNRLAVAAHARARRTVLLTAEATDGPLVAEEEAS